MQLALAVVQAEQIPRMPEGSELLLSGLTSGHLVRAGPADITALILVPLTPSDMLP